MSYCSKCGSKLDDKAKFCSGCGSSIEVKDSAPVVNTPAANPAPISEEGKTNGLAIAGFVLSIVSILCCGTSSLIGLILSIVGLNQIKEKNQKGKGLAIAGIVLSAIGILLIICFSLLGYTAQFLDDYGVYY